MINVKTAKSEITDVIETIEKWIPMFEQGNAPAVLTDVMELLDSQQAEIKRLKSREKIVIELTEDEANILCDFMEDEQNNGEYDHYWSADQREALDEVLYKLKCGLKDSEQE